MEEIFYGDWNVIVSQKNAAFFERFRIMGSESTDGIYAGIPGFQIPRVSGNGWKIILDWNNSAGSGWQPSAIRKIAGYTVAEGLIVMLGADDNFSWAQDFDFNDMVITLKCLDPILNPLYPLGNSYDFTVPHKTDEPGRNKQDGNNPDPRKRIPDKRGYRPKQNKPQVKSKS